MLEIERLACVNERCPDFGIKGKGNLTPQFSYGRHGRWMLRCKTCKTRFSETKGTALQNLKLAPEVVGQILRVTAEGNGVRPTGRIVGVSKNAVNRVILRVGEHCEKALRELLCDVGLTEVQLDELWSFIEKKVKPRILPTGQSAVAGFGSGQASRQGRG
jgi:transposase-like protein